jgi:hypothetical protein
MTFMVPPLPSGKDFGVLAEFDSPRALYQACSRVRDAGFTRWDAHTPFPIHGLERAMGLRQSRLGWLVMVMGMSGAVAAMLLQWWVATLASPQVISGKPLFSWQAFVPVTFEIGILGAAMAAIFGMFAFNQLPMLYHPLFNSERFKRVTNDKFFISIEAWDPRFDRDKSRKFLKELGAVHVEVISR